MLTSCAWCATPFPANDSIEEMPVGRRLAFDASKGRLWAVCRRCERWNLAPIEQRWEAIESCQRAFRETRLRASTDQVGLAKLRDGTELVRIGRPIPRESAAWRYGDQFGRRRAKVIALGVGGVAAVGALAAGAVALGASVTAFLPVIHVANLVNVLRTSSALTRERPLDDPAGGRVLPIGNPRLVSASEEDGGWGLEVPYTSRLTDDDKPSEGWWARGMNKSVAIGTVRLVGPSARDHLSRCVPRLNRAGAPTPRIRGAIDLIGEAGGTEGLPSFLARHRARFTAQQTFGDSGDLTALPSEVKLALEMAAHEETERALLAGELAALEAQWRGAEEEAAISDDLLLPPQVLTKLDSLRRAVERSR